MTNQQNSSISRCQLELWGQQATVVKWAASSWF